MLCEGKRGKGAGGRDARLNASVHLDGLFLAGKTGEHGEMESTGKIVTVFLSGAKETRSLGVALGKSLSTSVILLSGDLGSGKTTLVQGIGAGLGITEPIVSPTFTLINEYTQGRLPLYHVDLYRLEPEEVLGLNLESYWEGVDFPLGIVAIEWAERLQYKPDNYLSIHLNYSNDSGRQAKITTAGSFDIAALNF